MPSPTRSILVATSEEHADTYAGWLDGDWTVETVTDEDLVTAVEPDVAVVLLDRDLVGEDAEQLLDDLRGVGIDRPVVLITDEDGLGSSLGSRFSDHLVRPLDETEVAATVETMADRSDEAVQKQEYLALAASQAAMQIELSPHETAENEAYEMLTERIQQLRDRSEVPLEQFEDELSESLS
ncbi:MAG: HalX domain-containing protein [Halorientalis sp.]